jgi:hypothetical protein
MDVASNEGAYTITIQIHAASTVLSARRLGLRCSSSTAAQQDLPYNWSGGRFGLLLGIWKALQHILREVPLSFWALIQLILLRLRRFRERADRGQESLPCLPIPSGVWLQPDAYLYSQGY